jgi:hypothetical protein
MEDRSTLPRQITEGNSWRCVGWGQTWEVGLGRNERERRRLRSILSGIHVDPQAYTNHPSTPELDRIGQIFLKRIIPVAGYTFIAPSQQSAQARPELWKHKARGLY